MSILELFCSIDEFWVRFEPLWRQEGLHLAAPERTTARRARRHLITTVRNNMRNRLLPLADKLLLRKRAIIESINDQLKNISQIEHTRHRSPRNFLVNLLCGLIAYCHQPTKPSLHLDPDRDFLALPAA